MIWRVELDSVMKVIIGEEKGTIQDRWERSLPSTNNEYIVELVHTWGFPRLSSNGLIFQIYHLISPTSSLSQPSTARFQLTLLSKKDHNNKLSLVQESDETSQQNSNESQSPISRSLS